MPRLLVTVTTHSPATYSADPDTVRGNRTDIDASIKLLRATIRILESFHAANRARCEHPNKHAVYDPGYAGGGQDGYACPDCGGRLHL